MLKQTDTILGMAGKLESGNNSSITYKMENPVIVENKKVQMGNRSPAEGIKNVWYRKWDKFKLCIP